MAVSLSPKQAWRLVPPVAAALVLGLGILFLVRVLVRPLAILVLAITLGEALAPLVDRLQRRMRRTLAISVVYGVGFALIAAMALLLVPPLIDQGRELVSRAPDLLEQVRNWITRFDRSTGGQVARMVTTGLTQLGGTLVGLPLKAVSVALEVTLIIFLSIYWLIGAPALERWVLSLFPRDRRPRTAEVLRQMGHAMGGYVRGAAINAVIMGTLAWLGLMAIGVEYALVLGLITMLGEPIPYVGPILAAIPVIGVALLQSPTKAALALALFTALQQIEGHLLTPNIMRKQTEVPQALVIFALVAGGAVGGLLGALVALPLAGAVRVLMTEVVAPAIRRRTGAGGGGVTESTAAA